MEHELLGEDRLAAAGKPDDHVEGVGRQASAQHGVQADIAAQETVGHSASETAAERVNALCPSRSFTVETTCSGSIGF